MKAFAGIDLGGTNIKFGLADENGKTILFRTIPAPVGKGREPLLDRLLDCSEKLLHHAAENDCEVSYLGVGSPGTVDSEKGVILGHSPNLPGWQGTHLAEHLSDRLNLPVYVGNDANLMALAEVMFGAGRGYRNVVCTTIGTGIGGGIVLDGKVLVGSSYAGGELGHIPIIMDGRPCNCGLKGCLECYASAPGLLEYAHELAHKSKLSDAWKKALAEEHGLSIRQLFVLYHAGDKIAMQAVAAQVEYLASGLAAVVHLLNPEAIIIGGGVADAGGAEYVRQVEFSLRQRVFADASARLRVVKAKLGNRAGFIGAAFQREHA